MSYLTSQIKEECYGCRACAEACPKTCITMAIDENGFFYPVIDDDMCIHCNLCSSVCPNSNFSDFGQLPLKTYVAVHRNIEILTQSSSGGAYSAIASRVFDDQKDAAVYGVRFDNDFRVINEAAYCYEGTALFRKSKYIQSDTNGCFSKVKRDLQDGKMVLFTGLPCQVAALRSFLKSEYNNLICIDLVCHGVASQSAFDRYIAELEDEKKCKITSYEFKNKINRKKNMTNSTVLYKTDDGQEIVRDVINDSFIRAYYFRLLCRPSCYHCKYACPTRMGDITIGDAYGSDLIYSEIDMRKGASLILVNTSKGVSLISKLDNIMDMRELDYGVAVANNECLRHPTKEPVQRERFYQLLKNHSFEETVYTIVKKSRVKQFARYFLSQKQIDQIRKFITRR